MRVIEHGTSIYKQEIMCDSCGCKFEIDRRDIARHYPDRDPNDFNFYKVTKHYTVTCPDCFYVMFLKNDQLPHEKQSLQNDQTYTITVTSDSGTKIQKPCVVPWSAQAVVYGEPDVYGTTFAKEAYQGAEQVYRDVCTERPPAKLGMMEAPLRVNGSAGLPPKRSKCAFDENNVCTTCGEVQLAFDPDDYDFR